MSAILSKVGEILTSLGINQTFWFQLVIFVFAYFGMAFIVFKPYLAAYDERRRRTVGGEKEAEQLTAEANQLEEQYKKQARELNDKVKALYNEQQGRANKERTEILEKARYEAEGRIAAGRKAIDDAMSEARSSIKQYIPGISEKIESKFLRS